MGSLALKVRISMLWVFMAVAMSAHSVLAFMDPAAMAQLEEMELGAAMFLFMALFWWIPLVMAFLSVTLKDLASRWANIILGIIFTLLNIFHLIEHFAQPSAHQILIIGSTVVATALIFLYALRWRTQEA